ncbi:MAG: glycoside hydrolase family 13 protein [Microbacterium ginsengisoli]|jgi:alpha-glucosidase|uniref:glycoside hydrolase family 13 protein n=1 Tax=Microbacterium TaxID=33882 RepID=UPI000700DB9A|nr:MULTISPECIES: glycoside hydrolase family 13 protein [unclassified Microbacterium]KQR92158.1 alpha-amylase [Microbacterium sp. Leaf347]MBN9197772.1 glycoside hydrolase family 13 protein [Microbacterium ginsengisoli]OJU79311.1 MAG: alpha-amylase [Microbacterium sp. 71-23]
MTSTTDVSPLPSTPGHEWWRTAVIYQIYPRSFADSNGDGIGDLPGITSRLDALADLGVDAIWLSPFMVSPQRDAGYDVADYCDVDPLFGTLADFDEMLAQAHSRGIRVIVDLVPNHSSDQHVWFQQALKAAPGSPERARYIFRDGKGENGELPPNNWESVFGGGMWERVTEADGTLGQWYLHIFDVTQADFDWDNPEVREYFRGVLRFWLDRGVDGFRVDVAHGMIKKAGLPDYVPPVDGGSMGGEDDDVPYWGQPGVHEIYRDWHEVLAEYDGDRALCAEAWLPTPEKTALWVRPDEMHQAFNFPYLTTEWEAEPLRQVIVDSLRAFPAVGAPATWVLSNHDVIRHASRLALTAPSPQGEGIGPLSAAQPIPALGLRRARAATSLMLALPGSAYVYQGEELGLPEAIDIPDDKRQDPTWFRTNHEKYGRDGCRVPLPWTSTGPSFGFNSTGASWLPQPAEWAEHARDAETGDPDSTLSLYRDLLATRRAHGLGAGAVEWLDGFGDDVIAFRNGDVTVVANVGASPVALPAGDVLVASEPGIEKTLPADTTVWLRA